MKQKMKCEVSDSESFHRESCSSECCQHNEIHTRTCTLFAVHVYGVFSKAQTYE